MPKTGDDSTCVAMLMMFDDKLCTDKGEIMIDADDKLMKTFGDAQAKLVLEMRCSNQNSLIIRNMCIPRCL